MGVLGHLSWGQCLFSVETLLYMMYKLLYFGLFILRFNYIKAHFKLRSVCQKQVSRADTSNYIPQILWDVITCPALDTCFRHNCCDSSIIVAYHRTHQEIWTQFIICCVLVWFCYCLVLHIEGILPKGPYPPCLRVADRALLAGYPRYPLGLLIWHWDTHIYDCPCVSNPDKYG